MFSKVERFWKKAEKNQPQRPTPEEVARRLQRTRKKSNRDEIARGKKPVQPEEQSDAEDSDYRVSQEHEHSAESEQETEEGDAASTEEDSSSDEEIREVEPVQSVRKLPCPPALKKDQKHLLKVFKGMRFVGTRFPHQETLRELGMKRDVDFLLEMCGLATFVRQSCGAFKDETCQFLATLELHFYEDEGIMVDPSAGLGYISFTVNDVEYSLTMNQLDTLYGFPSGKGRCKDYDKDELSSLWKTIGDNQEYSHNAKSAKIRSPVIRYLHKSIANTFYARKVTGNVNEAELQFLDTALSHVIDSTTEGVELKGDKSDTGLTVTLLNQFLYYRSWASGLFKKETQGELSIGGVVTPILVAAGIDLDGKEFKPRWIDVEYLCRTGFLDRERIDGRLAYKFHHPMTNGDVLFPLPCVEHTKVRQGNNVDFCPPPDMCYDPYVPRSSQPQPQSSASDEEQTVDSSDQFDFEDYTAPKQGAAVRAANKNIGILKLWNKYQGKAIKSLKKNVGEMKEQIKELQRKLNISSPSRATPDATPDEDAPPPVMERSRSLHQDARASRRHRAVDPPRQSSFEPRETSRKKRAMQFPSEEGGTSSSYRQDPRTVDLVTRKVHRSRSERQQQSLPTYTRESMDASTAAFFSQQ